MQLIPAIDIRHGRCVRLLQGDFERETKYEVDPRELASQYRALGAEWLHIVDLDGAAEGLPVNAELVREIAAASGLRIQIGGGIRSDDTLKAALEYADRVVVGSLAATAPDRVAAWLESTGPDRITLGLDVRISEDGEPRITTHGWTKSSDLTLDDAIARYLSVGLTHVLCTDVARDGALRGPNLDLYARFIRSWPDLQLQASGGVRDASDLDALAEIRVSAAISGKALLEARISAEEMRRFLPNA